MDYVKGWHENNYESLCNQFGTPPLITSVGNVRKLVSPLDIYALDGRRVNATDIHQLEKGVYIVGGRKVLVK